MRADKEFAYVASGLDDGARIIVSSLDAVVNNMKVRTEDDKVSGDKQDNSAPAESGAR